VKPIAYREYYQIKYIRKDYKMSTLSVSELTASIAVLLTEAYAGPPNPRETWFIDNDPDAGILGVLNHVSAEEASTPVDGKGDAGSTIAANVEHLRWSLANTNATIRGEPWNPNWGESWKTMRANPEEWDRLRGNLRQEFESLRDGILRQTELPGEYLNGVIALIPHAAYHLGVIRQMVERIRQAR
jgi:hypothetical protein